MVSREDIRDAIHEVTGGEPIDDDDDLGMLWLMVHVYLDIEYGDAFPTFLAHRNYFDPGLALPRDDDPVHGWLIRHYAKALAS